MDADLPPREKRTVIVRARVPESTAKRLEAHVRSQGNVVSMSGFLYELVERELALVEISKQKIGLRVRRA